MAKDYKAEYAAKLRDPRWQKMRLDVMNRDLFMCQGCLDTTKTLNVHHTKYLPGKKPWEYELVSLVTLCEDCHKGEPEFYKESLEELCNVIREKRYTGSQLNMLQQVFHVINERNVHVDVMFIMDVFNNPNAIAAAKLEIDISRKAHFEKLYNNLERGDLNG